jgi:iron-sulfur cluster assembly protein
MKITILDKAAEMLKNKLESEQFLRVTVIEGGCAGLTYGAEIEREIKEGDEVVLQKGEIRIVSDPNSRKYLDGLTIDYSDDLINGGLQFTNSNTKTTCGCGASFSLSGFPVVEDGKCNN